MRGLLGAIRWFLLLIRDIFVLAFIFIIELSRFLLEQFADHLRYRYGETAANLVLPIAVSISFIAAVATPAALFYLWQELPRPDPIESRMGQITTSIRSASDQLIEFDKELLRRQEILDLLKRETETYQALANQNKAAVDALRLMIRSELEIESNKWSWWSIFLDMIKNTMFTLAGWGLSEYSARRRRVDKLEERILREAGNTK